MKKTLKEITDGIDSYQDSQSDVKEYLAGKVFEKAADVKYNAFEGIEENKKGISPKKYKILYRWMVLWIVIAMIPSAILFVTQEEKAYGVCTMLCLFGMFPMFTGYLIYKLGVAGYGLVFGWKARLIGLFFIIVGGAAAYAVKESSENEISLASEQTIVVPETEYTSPELEEELPSAEPAPPAEPYEQSYSLFDNTWIDSENDMSQLSFTSTGNDEYVYAILEDLSDETLYKYFLTKENQVLTGETFDLQLDNNGDILMMDKDGITSNKFILIRK
jgi:hypothetical protein